MRYGTFLTMDANRTNLTKTLPTIVVTPSKGGRVSVWRVKCTECGRVDERSQKLAAQKLAVSHAEEVHDQDAFIQVKN